MWKSKFSTYLAPVVPIYIVANVLALVPPQDNNISRFKLNLYRIYAASFSVLTACIHVAAFKMKIDTVYRYENAVVSFLDGLSVSALTLSAIISMIRSIVTTVISKFDKLCAQLNIAGAALNMDPTFLRTKKRFYFELIFSHACVIALFVYEAFVWKNLLGFHTSVSYMWHYFGHYCNLITVLLIYNYISAIGSHFSSFNAILNNISSDLINFQTNDGLLITKKLKALRKIYKNLSVVVEIFNEIFGWPLLFLGGIIFFGVLELINFVLVGALSKTFIDGILLENDFMGMVYLWCITLSVMGAVIVTACDGTTKEAQRTATICYLLMLKSSDTNCQSIREELVLLIHQATHHSPYFTAAGFLTIDTKMMFGLLGTVTSYIIVLIQINK